MGGLCRIPKTAALYVKARAFQSVAITMVLKHVGSIPIDRADPSPSSIKTAVDILQHGGVILIFPSGTRSDEDIAFRRGAATVALHARVPLVPAFFQGPKQIQVAHLMRRPLIRVTFGSPIPTASYPLGKGRRLNLRGSSKRQSANYDRSRTLSSSLPRDTGARRSEVHRPASVNPLCREFPAR